MNSANNDYINELIERAHQFPPVFHSLFELFASASLVAVNDILGPDRGELRIIELDVKQISAKQFQSIHNLNIWTFVTRISMQIPDFQEPAFAACTDFIGIAERESDMVNLIQNMEDFHWGNLCPKLISEYSEILHCEPVRFKAKLLLPLIFANAYQNSVDSYIEEIEKLN